MTQDFNRKIAGIGYNLLNLPKRIQFMDGHNTQYSYDATGIMKYRVVSVANSSVQITQASNYYPFGLPFEETYSFGNREEQPYKFGGKEYDEMHGLRWYDFEARLKDAILPVFSTMDPLAEKYYSVSPYVYCGNNPVRYVDPTGMIWDDASLEEDRLGNDQTHTYVLNSNANTTDAYVAKGTDGKISIVGNGWTLTVHEITHARQSLDAGRLNFNRTTNRLL